MMRKVPPGLDGLGSKLRGFTLIEVMIVVAIVAILAAIAVPAYGRYVTRAKLSEAFSLLSSMGIAAQQYYQDNRTFLVSAGATTTCPMSVPTHKNFSFSCSSVSASTITMSATGTADDLKRGRPIIFTLNQDGARATTQVPNGWVANSGACWVRTQTGDCS